MPIYMKYEGIVGTAKGKHNGWIELESCQIGINTATGARTGDRDKNNVAVSDLVITKNSDKASVLLFTESVSGTPRKVTVDFVKPGEEVPYMSIELENVVISSFSVSGIGSSGNVVPMESISMSYTKITYSLKPTVTPKDSKQAKDKAGFNAVINQ